MSKELLAWEKVAKRTARLKVIDGWLVLHQCSGSMQSPHGSVSYALSESMCFVPDNNHLWKIENKDNE